MKVALQCTVCNNADDVTGFNFMFENFSFLSDGLKFEQVHAKFTGWLVDLDLISTFNPATLIYIAENFV